MCKKEKKVKKTKIVMSMILVIIMLISFTVQTYGATAQSAKTVSKTTKTYVYGFNINDFGRWSAKASRQIKIVPISSSKLKITYHYLYGNKKDETYTANKVSAYDYEYDPKIYYFEPGAKEKISYYPKKGMVVFHGREEGKSYYFEKLSSKEKTTVKKLIKNIKTGSWWGKSFKYSIGIYENYVLVANTYGKLVGIYGIESVKQTSYGYFINIMGYNNYRWYKSMPNKLQCYSKASGSAGRRTTEDFWKFGC